MLPPHTPHPFNFSFHRQHCPPRISVVLYGGVCLSASGQPRSRLDAPRHYLLRLDAWNPEHPALALAPLIIPRRRLTTDDDATLFSSPPHPAETGTNLYHYRFHNRLRFGVHSRPPEQRTGRHGGSDNRPAVGSRHQQPRANTGLCGAYPIPFFEHPDARKSERIVPP
jgi:hypothetical protein